MGESKVRCRECGHEGAKLYKHIASAHGMTATDYRAKHGDAPLRSVSAAARQRARQKPRARSKSPRYAGTKQVACPTCETSHEVSKWMGSLHDLRCPSCKGSSEDQVWEGKSEPEDYVTCRVCGYRAENLVMHLRHAHPGLDYSTTFPDDEVMALSCAARDASYLQGTTLSEETKQKMSENAGRWNKGLTKETDERVATAAEKMRGRTPWNEGLTKDTDERIAEAARKLCEYVGEDRPWNNGLAADLTIVDFMPFLDSEGKVDRRAIEKATGLSWRTLYTYMGEWGLGTSSKYVLARAERATVRLEAEGLQQFALGNGKISVARAMRKTGHSFSVIKRECERHGLPTFTRLISQTICLDTVSEALGGASYKMEWRKRGWVNPPTGHRFRFDGYFAKQKLVVEFHGHQHYMFPNAFLPDESYEAEYLAMRRRDQIKKQLVEKDPKLTFMEVREDEPFDNVDYLRGRLVEMFVLPVPDGRVAGGIFDAL